MKRFIVIFFSTLLTVVISLMVLLYFFVNAERVEGYVGKAVGSEFDVVIGSAVMNPVTRTLVIQEIEVYHRTSDRDFFKAESLKISGIGILEALKGNFSTGALTLQDFYLDLSMVVELPESQENGSDAVIAFGRAALLNGELAFADQRGYEGQIHGLYLRTGSLRYDTGCASCDLLGEISDVELKFTEAEVTFWDKRYQLNATGFSLDEANGGMSLGWLTLRSLLNETDFFNSLEYRTELFLFDLKNFSVHGADFQELRENARFTASSVVIDSLDLHVTLDKAVPEDPEKDAVPMPLAVMDNLAVALALDEISVRYADIRYSEYDEDGERPGTIHFAETEARFENVQSGSSEPVVFRAQSCLEKTGKLETEIRFIRDAGQAYTEVTGSLGSFDVTLLNSIFKDLEGIEIKDGIVHHLEFDYLMTDDASEGTITIHYDNFSMDLIDRVDHEQGFRRSIASFFMDEIALRASSSNSEGDSRTGKIAEERDPEKGFFNYLWVSLRSGILDVVKRI